MRDLAMGGVFFPGLLVVGLVALLATLLLQPLLRPGPGPLALPPAVGAFPLYRTLFPAPAGG